MDITQEHIERYKRTLELRGYSEKYKRNLVGYGRKWVGRSFTQEEMEKDMLFKKGKENHNTKFYRSFLRNFIDVLKIPDIDSGILRWKGAVKEPKIVFYTMEEVKKIRDGISDLRLWLIINLMYEDGLRVYEVMNIKRSGVDLTNRRIKGYGKRGKTFSVPISHNLYKDLVDYIKQVDSEYLFQWENIIHQEKKVWYEIKRRVKKILPYKNDEEITNHAFRRSFGTHMVQNKINIRAVQKALRHKNLATTARYVEIEDTKTEKEWEKVLDKIYE